MCVGSYNDHRSEIEQLAGLHTVPVVFALISEMRLITSLINNKLTSADERNALNNERVRYE